MEIDKQIKRFFSRHTKSLFQVKEVSEFAIS